MATDIIILHWYRFSPFAQKVAWALNYKNIDYKTVAISSIEPRPKRRPLDGGYRKTPILQIGNHIYCDTKRILDEIEKRFPEPSLYPKTRNGQSSQGLAKGLAGWLDTALFLAIPSQFIASEMPEKVVKDRASFAGQGLFTPNPHLRSELYAQLELAQDLVPVSGDTCWILDTPTLSAADLHLAMDSFFARNVLRTDFHDRFPRLVHHLNRVMEAVKFSRTGDMPILTADEAVAVAAAAKYEQVVLDQVSLSQEVRIGQTVSVTPVDTGKVPVVGKLLALNAHEIVLERTHDNVRTIIHFPTIGFVVMPAKAQGNL